MENSKSEETRRMARIQRSAECRRGQPLELLIEMESTGKNAMASSEDEGLRADETSREAQVFSGTKLYDVGELTARGYCEQGQMRIPTEDVGVRKEEREGAQSTSSDETLESLPFFFAIGMEEYI